ncbi:MAG: MFS transporter [Corynebacterium sp.]|nr:MFS transporter [Corynebacterium sp.]
MERSVDADVDVTCGEEQLPREIWVLVSAAFVIALGFGLIAPIIPQYAISFDVPVAITTGAMAGASAFWHLLVLRGIAGMGSTMFTVSAMGLIVRLAPAHMRGRASSVYATAFLVGNILGPVVGALLTVLGMRLPFLIYGAAVLVAAGIVYTLLDRDTVEGLERKDPYPPMELSEALTHPSFQSNLVSGFVNGWSNMGARVAILPLFAAATFHAGGAIAGIALAAFAGGNAAAQQVSGRLSDRVGRKPLILSGVAVNAIFTAGLGFTHAPWSLLAVSVAAGFGAGLFNPAQQAVMADIIGRERSAGRILASFQMAQDCGSILGPIAIGMLADCWGYSVGFAACGALGVIALVVWGIRGRETMETRPRVPGEKFTGKSTCGKVDWSSSVQDSPPEM